MLGLILCAVQFSGFCQHLSCIHQDSIIQNSPTALNILCDPTVHLPSPLIPPPGNQWSSVSIVSPFPEHHIVGTIYCVAFSDKLLSLSKMHLRFLYIFPWLYRPFVFISKPYSTAWTYSLFIHSMTEGYGASQVAQCLKNPPAMQET